MCSILSLFSHINNKTLPRITPLRTSRCEQKKSAGISTHTIHSVWEWIYKISFDLICSHYIFYLLLFKRHFHIGMILAVAAAAAAPATVIHPISQSSWLRTQLPLCVWVSVCTMTLGHYNKLLINLQLALSSKFKHSALIKRSFPMPLNVWIETNEIQLLQSTIHSLGRARYATKYLCVELNAYRNGSDKILKLSRLWTPEKS